VIKLEGVTKRYPGADFDVLAGIDLEIGRGDFVSIVGRSGSGKTTLLNLIGGLDAEFEGTVSVDGRELRGCSDAELSGFRNRKVGFVFQAYHLLEHLNCRENVALAALFARDDGLRGSKAVKQRADAMLEKVGLAGSGGRWPATLSGGERQRVALARALFHGPPILLCDEPTGNLDAETGREVVALLLELHEREDVTVVAATHDEVISGAAGRVHRLAGGVLETGVEGPS
jgi:ABC-type lipoprotein export system ATPase subunit